MKNTVIVIIILILIALGIWYFMSGSQETGVVNLELGGDTGSTEIDVETVDLDTAKTFTITGRPYEYSEKEIKVEQGDIVVINFVNGQGTHDLRIDEFEVGTSVIQTGEKEMFAFVADKKGEFEYYCSVGNHRELGMVGTLIVE